MRLRAAEKLDEQKKQLQKELRDVDRLSFVSKQMHESIMESLQHQLQDVERRRHDLMPEHQKVQKRSPKIQSIKDKRKICRKKMLQRKKRCGSHVMMSSRKRSVSCFWSDKVEKNKMADADMAAELQVVAGRRRKKRQQCFAVGR